VTSLRTLDLSGCAKLVSLKGLEGCAELRELRLRFVRPSGTSFGYVQDECSLRDVEALAALTKLELLDLEGCTAVPESARGRWSGAGLTNHIQSRRSRLRMTSPTSPAPT
jgi:hypothetical protein